MAKADYNITELALRYSLEDRCSLGERGEYLSRSDDLFSLLHNLEVSGAEIWTSARLADHLGISRQAINNMITRGQLTVVSSDCTRWALTFIILSPALRDSLEGKYRPSRSNSSSPISEPVKPSIRDFQERGFSVDESKILAAGFVLVRYTQEDKTIDIADPEEWKSGWVPHEDSPFKTYAAAERAMSDMLKHPQCICVSSDCGEASSGGRTREKLSKAGFDFYRVEGTIPGHGTPRIKAWSKNWGTWNKYVSGAEVEAAWAELMKDDKALVG